MKKNVYLLLIALSFSTLASAQMPFAWWATLPADYATNPYQRQELKVKKVVDDDIFDAASVEAIWTSVEGIYVFDVNNQTSGHPEQAPEDYTGKCALMAGEANLYVIFNITDNEKSEADDKVEIVLSPQAGPKDVDPMSLLPDSTTAPWVWDGDVHDYHLGDNHFAVADIHDMIRYGLWSDDGDAKLSGIRPVTNQMLYASTMYFKDNYLGTDTARVWITPDNGATSDHLIVLEEDRTGGYFIFVAVPWTVMNDNALENFGDKMSIALQFTDNTEVTDSSYVYWGGTTSNDSYWGVRYYGAVAQLWDPAATAIHSNVDDSDINVFYSNEKLLMQDNVSSVEIYNISGSKIISVNNPKGSVELNSLTRGVYLAKVQTADGKIRLVKFIK